MHSQSTLRRTPTIVPNGSRGSRAVWSGVLATFFAVSSVPIVRIGQVTYQGVKAFDAAFPNAAFPTAGLIQASDESFDGRRPLRRAR
jgi:hypothetical protein